MTEPVSQLSAPSGCLLISKPVGISSFGVIETIQRSLLESARSSGLVIKKRDLPKFGHGGTLDPFATGLLIVCVNDGTKLSRYFLGSQKEYRATVRFGGTTPTGDPTVATSETCDHIPTALTEIREEAEKFTRTPYPQIPPMFSAKKVGGKTLYELAREGVEINRKPVEVRIYEFEIENYQPPRAHIRVSCSAGTYIRVLGQDLGKRLGSLAYLETLERCGSGKYRIENASSLEEVCQAIRSGQELSSLHCFVPFDRMLEGFPSLEISETEALHVRQGQVRVIAQLASEIIPQKFSKFSSSETERTVALFSKKQLVAIFSCDEQNQWKLDRVFQE